MTILSLEDSKALYDAGIVIETVHYYNGQQLYLKCDIESRSVSALPAPDLEELLGKLKNVCDKVDHELKIEYYEGKWQALVYYEGMKVIWLDEDYEDLSQALSNLLLKLKEAGYEV